MHIFDAILNTTNIKDAASQLGVDSRHIHAMLADLGVQHERGQKYKTAVQDFLDAGGPYQYDLFRETLEPDLDLLSEAVHTKLKNKRFNTKAAISYQQERTLVNSIGLEKI